MHACAGYKLSVLHGGPILASIASYMFTKFDPPWGDYFWQGGTTFGYRYWSRGTDFGSQNWSGGPVFLPKSVQGTDFGVTDLSGNLIIIGSFHHHSRIVLRRFTPASLKKVEIVTRSPVSNMCYPDKFTETEYRLCLIILVNCALVVEAWAWRSFCVCAMNDVMRW